MNAYRDQYAQLFRNGQDVVLIAISTDADTTLASWARDSQFPFLFGSDAGGAVGRRYGATVPGRVLDNRNLFVVGPDGRIAYRAVPFREVDPAAYTELEEALGRIVR
jgi:peroxiredoxin Q/BCP